MPFTSRTRIVMLSALVAAAAMCGSCRRDGPASRPHRAERGAASAPAPGGGDVWVVGRPYICRRTRGAITIDAAEHAGQWAHAMVIKDFKVPGANPPAKSRTTARLLWDDQNLYLHAVAEDVDLRATLKGVTARLWTEDVVELFLKPPGGGYYEFEVNPINALLDLEIPIGRHTRFESRAQWDSAARSAVAVKGTIGKPADQDESFRVVVAIPWKHFNFAPDRPPKPGQTWKFILARCDLSKAYGGGQELSTCVPLPKPDFHMYKTYPRIRFDR